MLRHRALVVVGALPMAQQRKLATAAQAAHRAVAAAGVELALPL